jgi:hypothetical protein
MLIVSIDAITRLKLAKGCCCSNMLNLHFLELPGARRKPIAWRETAENIRRGMFLHYD